MVPRLRELSVLLCLALALQSRSTFWPISVLVRLQAKNSDKCHCRQKAAYCVTVTDVTVTDVDSTILAQSNLQFDDRAATHGTDMLLLWDMFGAVFPAMPAKDVSVSRKLVSLVVDFAVNGKSTTFKDWKRFDESDPTYLVMDEEFTVKKGEDMPNQERYRFWDSQDVFWNYALDRRARPKEEL